MVLCILFPNVTVRCQHHRCTIFISSHYYSKSLVDCIFDCIFDCSKSLVDFITLQRDIHVYMKLFRLYIFPMLDIVIQRCGLIS